MKNIIIVGAGPAGCYLGQLLMSSGADIRVTILEEDSQVGLPVRCAGILGRDVFENLRQKVDRRSIITGIDGAEVNCRDRQFILRRKNVAALVHRDVFDRHLAAGLDIRLNTRFTGLKREKSGYLVTTNQGDFTAEIVVGADGPTSLVRRYIHPQKIEYISGYQVTIKKNPDWPANIIRVFFVRPFNEFIWVSAESKTTVRIGAMGERPREEVRKFMSEKNISGEILLETGGLIPVGLIKTSRDQLALLGDAAAQVKPLSGGGVYYGMKCAEILADCILAGRLDKYDARWKKKFGREIRLGLLARTVFERLPGRSVDLLFDILVEESAKIEAGGEFELHSTAFKKILANPKIFRVFGPAVWAMIKSLKRK